MLSSPFTESDEDVLSPVLGGGEAHRLQWTAAGPTGTLRGSIRGDLARLETGDRAQEELMGADRGAALGVWAD